jgi:hypothetical protein
MYMAEANNAVISPVGAVWRYIRQNFPLIELYNADGSHPSEAGSYAAACCFYTAIFKKDPTQIPYNFTLNTSDAAQIKSAAKLVVFDSLSTWHIGDIKAPTFPTGLFASAKTETSFTLSWTASSDDVAVTGYEIYKDGTLINTVTGTYANIIGLSKATNYIMNVKAKDAAGNTSALSSPYDVTTADFLGKIILTVSGLTAICNFEYCRCITGRCYLSRCCYLSLYWGHGILLRHECWHRQTNFYKWLYTNWCRCRQIRSDPAYNNSQHCNHAYSHFDQFKPD